MPSNDEIAASLVSSPRKCSRMMLARASLIRGGEGMTITDRNRILRFAYHWLMDRLRDPSIENVRAELRQLRMRLDKL